MSFEPLKILINGDELSSDNDKQISIYSPSFQYGLSILEGIRGYSYKEEIKLLELKPHIRRLIRSAKLIGFELPQSIEEDIKNDIYQITQKIKPNDI